MNLHAWPFPIQNCSRKLKINYLIHFLRYFDHPLSSVWSVFLYIHSGPVYFSIHTLFVWTWWVCSIWARQLQTFQTYTGSLFRLLGWSRLVCMVGVVSLFTHVYTLVQGLPVYIDIILLVF